MNTESTQLNSQSDSHNQATPESSGGSEPKRVTLPEPDPDNITVLTNKLPNKPILPWNHYDSPWKEEEEEKTDLETTPEEETALEATLEEVEKVAEANSPEIQGEVEAQTNGMQPELAEPNQGEDEDKVELDEVE